MIILVTGVPGSGKTLYTVGLIRDWLKEGRQVFSDINGLNLPGVLPAPEDWRECPDGSVIVYDECQQKFGPDGQGRSGREDVQEMETHRHRGMDIVLITQHPKLLHAHIRRLVGRHYHIHRMYGSHSAKVFIRDGHIDVDKPSVLLRQDNKMWSYPKEDFDAYKSATIHTHKRQLPQWLKRSAIGMVVVLALASFAAYKARGFFSGDSIVVVDDAYTWEEIDPPTVAAAPALPVTESPRFVEAVACISSATRCVCYGSDGRRLDLPEQECRSTLAQPPALIRSSPASYSSRMFTRPTGG